MMATFHDSLENCKKLLVKSEIEVRRWKLKFLDCCNFVDEKSEMVKDLPIPKLKKNH